MLSSITGAFFLPEMQSLLHFTIPIEPTETLFATSAEFIAAIIAVSFSLSILMVQHAASTYTPSLLSDYIKDISTWIVFSVLSFTVLFNLLSLILDWGQRGVFISIFLSIYSFIFLGFQFVHTSRIINPINVIERIQKRIIKYIHTIPAQVEKKINTLEPRTQFERALFSNELYRWFRFHSDRSLHEPSRKSIAQIVDMIQKSTLKRESETAAKGLDAISNVIEAYLKIRQTDTTPNDPFIEPIYEQLKSISNIAFENRDVHLLRQIINAFERIGKLSTKLPLISLMQGSHHLTGLSAFYIKEIGIKASQNELWDTAAEAVMSIKEVGVTSINENKDDTLTIDRVSEFVLFRNWYVNRAVFEAFSVLVKISIKNQMDENMLAIHLEKISETSKIAVKTLPQYRAHYVLLPLCAPSSRSLFEGSFRNLIAQTLLIKRGKFPKIETRGREEYVKNVSSDILETLRSVGLEAAKGKNALLTHDIVDSLYEIGILLLEEKFVTFKNHFQDELRDVVDYLEKIYIAWEGNTSIVPRDVIDSLTILAFEGMKNNQPNIASRIASILLNLSKIKAESPEDGNVAARIVDKIQMIGIFAVEKNQKDIATQCVNLLREFDNNIMKEKPRTSIKELKASYREDIRGLSHLPKDPRRQFLDNITEKSFTKFERFERRVKSN